MRQDSIQGLEVILKANSEYLYSSSKDKTETYDKCNWIITRVIQGLSFNDKLKDKADRYYVNISSSDLKKYLGTRDYKTIISLLIQARIVKSNDKYSTGNFSKSYCLTNNAFERKLIEVEVASESFKNRLLKIAEKNFIETNSDPLLKKVLDNTAKLIIVEQDSYYKDKLLDLTEEEMDNDIDPEDKLKERTQQYYRYKIFYEEFKFLNENTSSFELFKSKVYQSPTIAKSGRIYHTASSIPRHIRRSMRVVGGHYIWEVDMSAAQPTLLMLEWLKTGGLDSAEHGLCLNLILKGELYHYIQNNSQYFKALEYSTLKKEALQALYEPNTKSERNQALYSLFPLFMNWINKLKRKDYRIASHIGQSLEAKIFVEVYRNLPDDIFALIIHDSILCLESQTSIIKQKLIDRTIELFSFLKEASDLTALFKTSLVSIKNEELLKNKNVRLLAEYLKRKQADS